jgi:hypothetical protein
MVLLLGVKTMQYDFKVNQIIDFEFIDPSKVSQELNYGFSVDNKSMYHSRDSQINNLYFLSPKNHGFFWYQKIDASYRTIFFLLIDFLSVAMVNKKSFYKGWRGEHER